MKKLILAGAAGLLLAGCAPDYYAQDHYARDYYATNTYKAYPYESTWRGRPYVQNAFGPPRYYNASSYVDTRGDNFVRTGSYWRAEPIDYRIGVDRAGGADNMYWDPYRQVWVYAD